MTQQPVGLWTPGFYLDKTPIKRASFGLVMAFCVLSASVVTAEAPELDSALTADAEAGVEEAEAPEKAPLNEVVSVDLRKEGRVIVIRTTEAPKHSVFRMTAPYRLLIDITNATLSPNLASVIKGKGHVSAITTSSFSDGKTALARVEIMLGSEAPHHIRVIGNNLILSIRPPRDAPPPVRRDLDPKPEPFKRTRRRSGRPLRRATLGEFRLSKKPNRVVLSAPISDAVLYRDAMSLETLENPSRLVVDFDNAQVDPNWQSRLINRFGIRRMRAAARGKTVRAVFYIKDKSKYPVVSVTSSPARVSVVLTETLPDSEDAPAEPSYIARDVRFTEGEGIYRLTVDLDEAVKSDDLELRNTETQPILRVKGAELLEPLVRIMDVSALAKDVLSSISTYNEQGYLVIAAQMTAGTEHRCWRNERQIIWDFRAGVANLNENLEPEATAQDPDFDSEPETAEESSAELLPASERYTGRRISLDLRQADIRSVLRMLSKVSGLNIVASDSVSGRINFTLRNIPWDQALDIIVRAENLNKIQNGNIILVAPADELR